MPKVPRYNHKPLKSIYNPTSPGALATMKQKNLIMTLCERKKLPLPNMKTLTMGEASSMISNMMNE